MNDNIVIDDSTYYSLVKIQVSNIKYNVALPFSTSDQSASIGSGFFIGTIIPTKNNLKYIRNNIFAWQDVVNYENYEIIIADTGSDEAVIKEYDE